MQPIELIVEKNTDGQLWGRINYEDNLMVDVASDLIELKQKMVALLTDCHEVNSNVSFIVLYDLTSFFDEFDFLKLSKIAERASINPKILRAYSTGAKMASAEQVTKIENAMRGLARKFSTLQLA